MKMGKIHPGDLVEVRSPIEILSTLDAEGTLDHLPFMPEMISFCGQRFQVSKRVVKTCASGLGSTMRGFRNDDVVLLDGLRCSGVAHDGCQKACMIFWREPWLRKVEDAAVQSKAKEFVDAQKLRARLKTSINSKTYFCQASELLVATNHLSRTERFSKCFAEIRAGNCTTLQMVQRILIWSFWRIRRVFFGEYARGAKKSTPAESLNLAAGEHVEVKAMGSILKSLNNSGRNRGLYFSPDMRLLCGKQQRVERKVEKIIVDGTGEMRQLRDTVFLKNSLCGCSHVAFGGCARCEFVYWREIWLRRSEPVQSSLIENHSMAKRT